MSAVNVRLFASLREQLGEDTLSVPLSGAVTTVAEVVELLGTSRGDNWREALADEQVLTAVNQTIVARDHHLVAGDELAFLPPVTGG